MNNFRLLSGILLFLLFSRYLRAVLISVTQSFVLGTIFNDLLYLLIYLIAILVYLKGGRFVLRKRSENILATLIFAGAVGQALFFFSKDLFPGLDNWIYSLSNLRRYFLALPMFYVFIHLIEHSKLDGGMVIDEVGKVLTLILKIAVAIQIIEYLLRTFVPGFEEFYTRLLIAPLGNLEVESGQFESLSKLHKTYFGFSFRRSFGIGLDFYTSGAIISICYYYYVFFSKRFAVLSLANAIVGFSLVLTGSLQFIIPFVIVNVYYLISEGRTRKIMRVPLAVAGGGIIVILLLPALMSDFGYLAFALILFPGLLSNLDTMLFGWGPIRLAHFGNVASLALSTDISDDPFFDVITDFGFVTFVIEVGLIISFAFFVFIFWMIKKRKLPSNETKVLLRKSSVVLLLSLFAFTLHSAVFFNHYVLTLFLTVLAMHYYVSNSEVKI